MESSGIEIFIVLISRHVSFYVYFLCVCMDFLSVLWFPLTSEKTYGLLAWLHYIDGPGCFSASCLVFLGYVPDPDTECH